METTSVKDKAKRSAINNKRLFNEREREVWEEAYEFGYRDGVREVELCFIYGSNNWQERINELKR